MNSRWIGLLVVSAIVVLGLIYGFMPRPVEVETARATVGPILTTVSEEGKTRVVDRFVISAPVAGFARRVTLDVGDPIEDGSILVQLEPLRSEVLDLRARAEASARVSAAVARSKAAEKQIEAAEAAAEVASVTFDRVLKLFQANDASQEELDLARSEAKRTAATLESARFNEEVAHFEVEVARTALQYSAVGEIEPTELVTLRSPIVGAVLEVFRESEGVVAAGMPMLEIGDPRALEVEVDVLSEDAVSLQPGMQVFFERWGGEKPLEGRVRVVEPTGFTKVSALGVEEQRVLVISDLTSEPEEWARLGHGYRVEARFVIAKQSNVLRVPSSALFRHGDSWVVFRVENNKARRVLVETGPRSGVVAAITSGLADGDEVILYPGDQLEDGSSLERRFEPKGQ